MLALRGWRRFLKKNTFFENKFGKKNYFFWCIFIKTGLKKFFPERWSFRNFSNNNFFLNFFLKNNFEVSKPNLKRKV